jgi:hypothetical protein
VQLSAGPTTFVGWAVHPNLRLEETPITGPDAGDVLDRLKLAARLWKFSGHLLALPSRAEPRTGDIAVAFHGGREGRREAL